MDLPPEQKKSFDWLFPVNNRINLFCGFLLDGKFKKAEEMLEKKLIGLNEREDFSSETCLIRLAQKSGFPPERIASASRFLLDRGANVDAQDVIGRTALHHACVMHNIPAVFVSVLLEYGADPMIKDNFGNACIVYPGALELVESLLAQRNLAAVTARSLASPPPCANEISTTRISYEGRLPNFGEFLLEGVCDMQILCLIIDFTKFIN